MMIFMQEFYCIDICLLSFFPGEKISECIINVLQAFGRAYKVGSLCISNFRI